MQPVSQVGRRADSDSPPEPTALLAQLQDAYTYVVRERERQVLAHGTDKSGWAGTACAAGLFKVVVCLCAEEVRLCVGGVHARADVSVRS